MSAARRWGVFMVLLTGCGPAAAPPSAVAPTSVAGSNPPQKSNQIPGAAAPGLATASAAAPEETAPEPEDLSLTIEQYQKLGMPPSHRLWNSADMAKAARVLAKLAEEDPSRLPRYKSEKSGKVFSRMTNLQNIDQLRSTVFPPAIRLGFGLQFIMASSSFGKTYAKGLLQEKTGGDEASELIQLNLHIAVAMNEIAGELLAADENDEKKGSKKLAGLKLVQEQLSTILQGALVQAAQSRAINPEARERLLATIEKTLPTLIDSVPPAVRKEVLKQLRELSLQPEYARHRDLLERMTDKLEKSIKEAEKE